MNTITKKIRLFLFAITTMVGMSAFGQNIVLSSSSLPANSEEQDLTFRVLSSDVDWTVSITYPDGQPTEWLSVKSNGTGTTSDAYPVTVTLHCTKNSTTAERLATVKVSGEGITKSIVVTQYGEDPNLTVNPSTLTYNEAAGTQSINITSNLSWNATINYTDGSGWLTLSSSSGTGDKELTLSAKANTGSSGRKATITISGGGLTRTVEVTQTSNIYLNVKPASLQYNEAAGTQTIDINSNLTWNATVTYADGNGWLTLSSSSGTGDKEISVSTSANTGTSERHATITVSGGGLTRTVEVTQTSNSYLNVKPASLLYNEAAGTQTIDINSNLTWNATINYIDGSGWLTLSSSSGTGDKELTLSAKANTGSSGRKATITISGGGLTRTVEVTQGFNGYLTVSPASLLFNESADTQSINITSNLSWNATINYIDGSGWLTLSSSSGTGDKELTLSAKANTAPSERKAIITISGSGITRTVEVTQRGIGHLTVSPASLLFNESAGTQSINITSNLSWNATINYIDGSGWLTLSSSSGTGNKEISVSTEAHTGSSERKATITLSGSGLTRTVEITQKGNGYLNVSPASLSYNEAAGNQTIYVTSNLSWNATINYIDGSGWLTLSSSSGTGNKEISVSTEAHTGSSERKATITISGSGLTRTIEIAQQGNGHLTVSPARLLFSESAGNQTVYVMSNLSWNATINYIDGSGWLTLSSSSGSGDKEISVIAEANTGSSTRKATITITGSGFSRNVEVTQYGTGYLAVSQTSLYYNDSESSQTFQITSNVKWNATIAYVDGNGWLTLLPSNGNGNKEITVKALANTGSSQRKATITITGGGFNHIINVTQYSNSYLTTNAAQLLFNPAASEQKFNISSNVNWNITMEGGNGWLDVTPTSKSVSGNDVTEITVKAADNTGNSNPREATITISGGGMTQEVLVKQAGNGYLTASTAELKYNPSAHEQKFNISSNVNWNITVEGGNGWLTVTPTSKTVSGNDDTEIIVKAADNTGNSSTRTATIIISGGGMTQEVLVKQAGNGYLTASTTELRYNPTAYEQKFNIESNVSWNITMEGGNGWLTVTPTNKTISGNDVTEVTVNATDNTGNSSPRTATITISGGGLTQKVVVTQEGKGYLTANTAMLKFNNAASEQKFKVSSNVSWNITMEGGNGWLTVTPMTENISGNTDTEVTVNATDNTGNSSPRTATLTISGGGLTQKVIVTQEGIGYLTASVTELKYNNGASEKKFNVSSNVNWTITMDGGNGWLTVTPMIMDVSGNTDTEVTVKAADNTGNSSPRTATLTITGGGMTQKISVKQEGTGYLTANVTELKYNNAASEQKFNVSSNVSWNITMEGGNGWLTVTPTSKNVSGNDVTEISVSATNNIGSSSPREATIIISGGGMTQEVRVEQAGNGYLTASTAELKYSPKAYEQKFIISSNVSWNITMEGGNGWLTVTPTSKTVSDNDVTEISVSTTDNTGNPSPREAMITITGGGMTQTIKVYQAGNGYLMASHTNLRYNPKGGTLKFNVSSNVSWNITMEGGNGWLTVNPMTKAVTDNADTEVSVKAEDNTGNSSPRTATITISGGGLSQTIQVYQDGTGYLQTNKTELKFNPSAYEQKFNVSSNVSWNITVEGGTGWLKVTPKNKEVSGHNVTEISVVTEDNTQNPSPRTATITISGGGLTQSVIVTQAGNGSLTASTTYMRFNPDAATLKFNIMSNVDWNISIEGGSGWLSVSPSNGKNNGEIAVTTTANTGNSPREATITIYSGGLTQTVNVYQAGSGYLTVNTTLLRYNPNPTTQEFTITSNVAWNISIEGGGDWLTTSTQNGNGNGNVAVSVTSNKDNSSPRSATITITGDGLTQTVNVYQSGYGYLTVDKTVLKYNDESGTQQFKIESNVNWSISVDGGNDWLTISPMNKDVSGEDVTVVTVSATDNKGNSSSRSATITVSGSNGLTQVISVIQPGSGYLTVDKTALKYNDESGTQQFKIESNVKWFISVDGGNDWLTISPMSKDVSGEEVTEVTVSATDNTGSPSPRNAKITITGDNGLTQTVNVNQAGTASLAVSTTKMSFSTASGSQTFNIESNVDWRVANKIITGGDVWISVEHSEPTKNDGIVTVTVQENPNNSSRESTITVTWSDGTSFHTETISVFQYGSASLTPSTDQITFSNASQTIPFKIESNVDWKIVIDEDGQDWLSATPTEAAADQWETFVDLKVAKNENRDSRSTTVNILWNDGLRNITTKIAVLQNDEAAQLTISTDTITFAVNGGIKDIAVKSNATWKATSDAKWLSFETPTGYTSEYSENGDKTIRISVEKTDSTYLREATITVTLQDANVQKTIPISQYGTAKLTHSNKLEFKVNESSESIEITDCNVDWRVFVEDGISWLRVESPESMTGKGDGSISMHADFNDDTKNNRTTYVYIRYLGPQGDSITSKVPVIQDRCPKVPEKIALEGLDLELGVESEIGEDFKIAVATSGYDKEDKWLFNWSVDGKKLSSNSNALNYNPSEKRAYEVEVEISYKDDPTNELLKQKSTFKVYPCPKSPTNISTKGNGSSGIMFASVDNATEQELKDNEYEFVFGYDASDGTPQTVGVRRERYCQYPDAKIVQSNVNKWVYTQWVIDNRTIKSKKVKGTSETRAADGIEEIGLMPALLKNGHLTASFAEPTPALIMVLTTSGSLVKQIQYQPRYVYNENILPNDLETGLYIIRCTIGDQTIEEKAMIK